MLGVIVLLCFKIPASFIFLSPIVTIYLLFVRKVWKSSKHAPGKAEKLT